MLYTFLLAVLTSFSTPDHCHIDSRVLGNWKTETPLEIANGVILGFDLDSLPKGVENARLMTCNQWYTEGVIYEELTKKNTRKSPSSFKFMFTDHHEILVEISSSAAKLETGQQIKLASQYNAATDELILSYNGKTAVFKRSQY